MKYFPFKQRKRQRGYVMIVAMILLALLAVLGTSTLNIAGIDQRIAYRNRQHMVVLHTANAGVEHAREQIQTSLPASEGYDVNGTRDSDLYITQTEGDTEFAGYSFGNQTVFLEMGIHPVDSVLRCGRLSIDNLSNRFGNQSI